MDDLDASAHVARLRVVDLKYYLRSLGLPCSGNKDALAARLRAFARSRPEHRERLVRDIDAAVHRGPTAQLATSIPRVRAVGSAAPYRSVSGAIGSSFSPIYHGGARNGPAAFGYDVDRPGELNPLPSLDLDFLVESISSNHSSRARPTASILTEGEAALRKIVAEDPFFELVRPILACTTVHPGHHTDVVVDMSMHKKAFEPSESGRAVRVLLYCTNLQDDKWGKHHWPAASDLLVNHRPVELVQQCRDGRNRNKALLERPADVLSLLMPHSGNNLRFAAVPCAVTSEWVFGLYLVEERTTKEMLQVVRKRPLERCIAGIKEIFGDGEVVFSDMTVKLRDPISFARIRIPAKGANCNHVQSFDAEGYFDFQRKAKNAKWQCFVCQRPVPAEKLEIDSWFVNVLEATANQPEVDEVEYFADGTWKAKLEDDSPSSSGAQTPVPEPSRPVRPAEDELVVEAPPLKRRRSLPEATLSRPPIPPSADYVDLLSDDES